MLALPPPNHLQKQKKSVSSSIDHTNDFFDPLFFYSLLWVVVKLVDVVVKSSSSLKYLEIKGTWGPPKDPAN